MAMEIWIFLGLLLFGGWYVLKKSGYDMPNLDLQEHRRKNLEKEIERLKKEKDMMKLEEERDKLREELEELAK